MVKTYIDADNKYVGARIVYGKAADHKLYLEPEFTNQVDEGAVASAFMAGVLVVAVGTAFVRPAQVDGNEVDVNGTTYEAKANV